MRKSKSRILSINKGGAVVKSEDFGDFDSVEVFHNLVSLFKNQPQDHF